MIAITSCFDHGTRCAPLKSLALAAQVLAGPVNPPALAQSQPILFVTQVPIAADFTSVTSTFGNHQPTLEACGRGGDLYLRYPDGSLRNLTRAAGFGRDGDQSGDGIAVREPCVHWNGQRALFSMVVGAPRRQYDYESVAYWQIYEITNFLDPATRPVITRVPGQPADYNNVSPAYTATDDILFTSDRPRAGERHLYPQRDEYEEAPTVTGLWRLSLATGELHLLNHAPSGVFSPFVDSFGRVVFIRWDHLQRDQQADDDAAAAPGSTGYGTFNYRDESAQATILPKDRTEVFPETRLGTPQVGGHTFNQFFPWQINDDGTEEETINHVGRHELGGSYRSCSFRDDPNLGELYFFGDKFNTNTLNNFLQIRESPTEPGLLLGTDAPEFGTHGSGQLIALEGAPSVNPDRMRLRYLTPRSTAGETADGETPPADHSGHFRNPLPLSDGTLVAVHTAETRGEGTAGGPLESRYDFRLKRLRQVGPYYIPDAPLTPGIRATIQYWSPDSLITRTNLVLWELDPVEVRARPRPTPTRPHLASPELQAFAAENVDVAAFQRSLATAGLALIVSRNLTTRDHADFQQPFNLRVPGGVETIGQPGRIYDIAFLQLFQGDLIRGIGLTQPGELPQEGRRVLARALHDPAAINPPLPPDSPTGAVRIASDGSMAALVPARRALSWQLTGPAGEAVVRERYWLTFQPGEIRTCAGCHGVNTHDQANQPPPTNTPRALGEMLRFLKNSPSFPDFTQRPRFLGSSRNPDATFTFHAAVVPSLKVQIESSTNLIQWEAVTNLTPVNGDLSYPVPALGSTRFFRLRQ